VLAAHAVIDKTNTLQEKTDLTLAFLGDKVQQTVIISGEMRGEKRHDRGPL